MRIKYLLRYKDQLNIKPILLPALLKIDEDAMWIMRKISLSPRDPTQVTPIQILEAKKFLSCSWMLCRYLRSLIKPTGLCTYY